MVKETGRIESAFFALGLTRRTRSEDVLALIRKLRPLDCGFKLIRVGSSRDGGYLVPDDLDGIEYCFSPGVSTVSDFENQLAERGIRCFLADYSVEAPPIARAEFTFDKKFIGPQDSGNFMTLASWKNRYLKDYSGDLILQMDIEGAEYDVLQNTADELLDQFRIVVVEYHFLERMFYPDEFEIIAANFEKLLRIFHVVHLHPNNCGPSTKKDGIEIPKVMEITLLNKRRARSTKPRTIFPHPLDADNVRKKPLILPRCWYM